MVDWLSMLNAVVTKIKSRYFRLLLNKKKGLRIHGNITVYGKPIITIRNNASIVIEDNVTLNSQNWGYHINMHSPVKLFADRKNACIQIGENTRIHGSCIHAYESIIIGKNCLISANCQIFDGQGHDLSFEDVENRIKTKGGSKPITIHDNVWICINSIILPGVTIGEGSVIAAGSVVTHDIPPFTIAGGNPAKIIKDFQTRSSD